MIVRRHGAGLDPPYLAKLGPMTSMPSRPDNSATTLGRLLYIEDNAVNTLVVEELVGMRPQLRLDCAVDGGQGVAMAQALQPDLILLDLHLPDCSGYEVLERLRAEPLTAHIPCIAVSADGSPEDQRLAKAAGFAAYWTKPIDFKAFLQGLDDFFAPKP
jgi:CheY-like chemotaxis protein